MNIQRRNFNGGLLAATMALSGAAGLGTAQAQGAAPVEGKHYVKLSQPVTAGGGGKVEVVEFFWYGCPHCNSLEPALDAWVKKLPADVVFRRVPVAFREEPFGTHQRLYYALEAMGQVDAVHRKVFHAIHVDRQRLDKIDDVAAFVAKNGVDKDKFVETFNSFGVQTKVRQARQLAEAYKVDGVPSIGVQGRYYTTGSMAGSLEGALTVAEHLIERARKGN